MAVRIFLGLSVLVWLPYGIFCFFQPGYLAEAAGVASASSTGTIELRAMYGGLQAAIGILAALSLVKTALTRPALVTIAFLCGGLFFARLLAAVAAAEVSPYTGFALVFESASVGFAAWLLSRPPGEASA